MKLRNTILISLFIILALSAAVLVYGIFVLKNAPSVIQEKTGAQPSPSVSSAIPGETESLLSGTSTEASIRNQSTTSSNIRNCAIQKISDTVHGGSMSGIVEDGQQITILKNYYSCNDVQRNDLVIYNYAGNKEPLIKIVRGIPGDKWTIKLDSQGYEIIVNGKPLKTSKGELYQIPTGRIQVLELYAKSYPIIPANTYLIMGNLPEGSIDSVRFGLVGKVDIIGKAVIK